MSARRKKVSKKHLKVTFTQAYPRSFYAFLQPRNSRNLVSSISFQWSIQVAHLVVQIDPMRVLGERTRPCRKESPLAQPVVCGLFSGAAVGRFEASDPITFHGHPKWCQGAAGVIGVVWLLVVRCAKLPISRNQR